MTRPHSTHGKSTHVLYQTWNLMIQRCHNKNLNYKNYMAKGIKVCYRWRHPIRGFKTFLKDMGARTKGTTLDRFPNKNGNYEPGNCRWATKLQQACNTRANVIVKWKGKKYPLTKLIRILNKKGYNLTRHNLYMRLRRGWSIKKAVGRPLRPLKSRRS